MGADKHDEAYAIVKAARSPEYTRRCAVHESSHALLALAQGGFVEMVTIMPDGVFAGRCVRRGAPSTSLNLLNQEAVEVARKEPTVSTETAGSTPGAKSMPTTLDIVSICEQIGTPEIGTPRVDLAEEITRAQVNIIELVGGNIGERVLFPDLPPLPAEHDWMEARALASVVCASTLSIGALLAYAEAEAEALIRAYRDVVEALTEALVAKGTLFSGDVSAIVSSCLARRALAAEQERRKRWQSVIISASYFKPE